MKRLRRALIEIAWELLCLVAVVCIAAAWLLDRRRA